MKTVSSPPKTVRLQYGGSSLSLTSTQYSSSATCIKKKKKRSAAAPYVPPCFLSFPHPCPCHLLCCNTVKNCITRQSCTKCTPESDFIRYVIRKLLLACRQREGHFFFSIASSWKRSSCKAWALTMLQPCGLLDVNHVLMVPVTVCKNLIRGPFDDTDKKRHVAHEKLEWKMNIGFQRNECYPCMFRKC